ncbi:MAG: hypothetical protein ABIG44_11490 [Planctomycetota bacterium]
MPTVASEQVEQLTAAIQSHDFLRRLLESLEQLHRLVFHADESIDWSLVHHSAEQILIAEIVSRHDGDIDGIYHALRTFEGQGRPWGGAIQELASNMHSYFTTPLGIVMRNDLFGDDAVFISPEAHDWIRARATVRPTRSAGKS